MSHERETRDETFCKMSWQKKDDHISHDERGRRVDHKLWSTGNIA